jgi:transcriptional regulator with XRE-family HTH domain
MLGKELLAARLAAGLTQETLAYRANVDRSYISQLERGLKSPTVAMLIRLCKAMDTSAAKIVGRVERRGR